jgi:hypothetical protein
VGDTIDRDMRHRNGGGCVRRSLRGLAVLAALAGPTRAQPATDAFGIERFRLAPDRDGLLDVDAASVPEHLTWGVGVWLGFAHDPLVVYDRDMTPVDALVARRLTTGLAGSIALWDRVELGLGLELVGYQRGAATEVTILALPTAGIGDVRVAPKVRIARFGVVDLAVVPTVIVPMGSPRGYLREAGPVFAPELAASAVHGRVRGAANLGYRIRERVQTAGLVIDDEAFVRAALGVTLGAPRAPMIELVASMSAAAPLAGRDANQVAIEVLLGAARRVAPGIAVQLAGGAGLDNGFGVPDWRVVLGVRVARGDAPAPATFERPGDPPIGTGPTPVVDPDPDRDGITGERDRCPDEPEDLDGFEDEDGCPDPAAILRGRVADSGGRAIARATVRITHTDHPGVAPIELVADDDGAFEANVHGGTLEVTASAPDYQLTTSTLRIEPGASAAPEVRLPRAVRQGQLRGQILSFGGKPVAATIKISGPANAETQTDPDGRFELDLPDGTFAVVIEATGFVTQRRSVKVKLDGVTVLNVDMRGKR